MSLSEPRIGEPGRSTRELVLLVLTLSKDGKTYSYGHDVDYRLMKNTEECISFVHSLRNLDNKARIAEGMKPLPIQKSITVRRTIQLVQNQHEDLRGSDYDFNHKNVRQKVAQEIRTDSYARKNPNRSLYDIFAGGEIQ